MKLLLYTFFVALAVPLFTYSLDPRNPQVACERFLVEKDKQECLKATGSANIDWYASSLCEKIDDDKIFLNCFSTLEKAQFDPRAIEACESLAATDDDVRMKCLNVVKNKSLGNCGRRKDFAGFESCMGQQSVRSPASTQKFFQK